MEVELPINRHLDSYGNKTESGIVPNQDTYTVYTQNIDTSSWGGRNINFTVDSLGLDRLIVGSKCFLRFLCTAKTSADANILTANPIELREGAGNLIIENSQLNVAGSNVFNDNFSVITRHFFERLANSNHDRIASTEADRYITQDSAVFGLAANTLVSSGIRKTAITDGKQFMISRPLSDITFFGPRDAALPAALPLTFNFTLNSIPGRLFNTDDTITSSPKLNINAVELHIYTVKMEDAYAASFRDALRSGTLMAACDRWATQSVGSSVASAQSLFSFPSDVVIETTPDILGLAFFPDATYNNTTAPYKGQHPLTTSWLNTSEANLTSNGRPLRFYRQLGGNSSSGLKQDLCREVSEFSGYTHIVGSGRSAIDMGVYSEGYLSFVPIAIRSVSEETVLDPKPFSLNATATMTPNAGSVSSAYLFYKLRHMWNLSTEPGQTKIVK